MENLDLLYAQTKEKIAKVDFDKMWKGFYPFPFALYDDEKVILDGKILPKTDDFYANTSAFYDGRWIAMWKCVETLDLDVLASKIIHEMFHAFQMSRNEKRFADEFGAVTKYRYDKAAFAAKRRENCLLAEMTEDFSTAKWENFLGLRAFRKAEFPYEYDYETKVETIEGSARYVELMSLKYLDRNKYRASLQRLIKQLRTELVPVRTTCYDSGGAILLICAQNDILFCPDIDENAGEILTVNAAPTPCGEDEEVNRIVDGYFSDLRACAAKAKQGKNLAEGQIFGGFNVYSPRSVDGYVFSDGFLCFTPPDSDQTVFLDGDYLFKTSDRIITELYKIEEN